MPPTEPRPQRDTVPVFRPLLEAEEQEAARAALELGWLGMGSYVSEFEQRLAEAIGAGDRHVVAVSTGHAALHLALLLLGVGPGDEVITPAFNNVADFQAILATGASPVFCDIDERSLCIDLAKAEELIGPRTRAMIVMDYDCMLCDHDGVAELQRRRGIRVVHDAAHVLGSSYRGRPVGSFSDLTVFSFDPVKTITCIDGGALVVRSREEVAALQEMRLIGMGQPADLMYRNQRAWTYDVGRLGFRYHLANLHAAIGLAQLRKLGRISASRQETARYYNTHLAGVPDLAVPATDFTDVTPFLYYIRVPAACRDDLRTHLRQRGIDTGIHWQPGHWFSLLRDCRRGDLAVTERAGREILSLPLHSCMAAEHRERVVNGVADFFGARCHAAAALALPDVDSPSSSDPSIDRDGDGDLAGHGSGKGATALAAPAPANATAAQEELPTAADGAATAYAADRHSARRVATLIFVACLACYLANGRVVPIAATGDTFPTRLVPFSLLAFGTVTLDPFRQQFDQIVGRTWFLDTSSGRWVSRYPIGASVVAMPVYLPVYLWLRLRGEAGALPLFGAAIPTEKAAAAILSAAAVAVLYLVLRRFTTAAAALWSALAFGLATNMWAIASQALWQHGPMVLMICLALWLLTAARPSAVSALLAGGCLALAHACRPTAMPYLLAGMTAVALGKAPWPRRLIRVGAFAIGALPILLLLQAYNQRYFAVPFGAYGDGSFVALQRLPSGLAGLLLSPNRGLFVFTPIAVVGAIGVARSFRYAWRQPLLPLFGLATLVTLAVTAVFPGWAGGWSFGPRYLIDLLPVLAIGGARELPRLHAATKAALVPALAWSLVMQLIGAFCYPASGWNARHQAAGLERSAWSGHFMPWEDFQAWRRGPHLVTPLGPADQFVHDDSTPCVHPGASGRQLLAGWYDRELPSGRWTKPQASLQLGPPADGRATQLVVLGANWAPFRTRVRVQLDGRSVIDGFVEPGGYQLAGAVRDLPPSSVLVAVAVDPTFVPSAWSASGDSRQLGTFISSICLQ